MYKIIFKPLLFLASPETAHHIISWVLNVILKIPGMPALLTKLYRYEHPSLQKEVFGLKFPNPVGLAAGYDKDANLIDAMSALGFGFVEIGTVTPKPQEGNPKPRLFRLPADTGIINRMGFNNQGIQLAVKKLKNRKSNILVGGNIGKNKDTANEDAVLDYEKCFDALYHLVDYFAVNVSSPNTPGLRALQEKEPLKALLLALMARGKSKGAHKPILLKIAPDLGNSQLNDILEIVEETGIDGIIATNTTITRDGLETPKSEIESIGAGGLSGAPLKNRSTEVIRYLSQNAKKPFPIIGVGGICSPQDALEKLEAGATLVQIYSGMIYEGPALIKKINKYLAEKMA